MSGPSFCQTCGQWPARMTLNGLRCHLCECRDYCNSHPVPLPRNADMLRDLAKIGVPGAAEALDAKAGDLGERLGGGSNGSPVNFVSR